MTLATDTIIYLLVKLEFSPNDVVYLTSAPHQIEYEGETYVASGGLFNITLPSE